MPGNPALRLFANTIAISLATPANQHVADADKRLHFPGLTTIDAAHLLLPWT
jgi:hypothetical protein